jgi:hypothetical protein
VATYRRQAAGALLDSYTGRRTVRVARSDKEDAMDVNSHNEADLRTVEETLLLQVLFRYVTCEADWSWPDSHDEQCSVYLLALELEGFGDDMDAARLDAATALKNWATTWTPWNNVHDDLTQEEFAYCEIARLATLVLCVVS